MHAVEQVAETLEFGDTFTSSDDLVKSKPLIQATPTSYETPIMDTNYTVRNLVMYGWICVTVDEVRKRVNNLRGRFSFIRRSMIQCLDKCQIAVMTVVTLLSSVLVLIRASVDALCRDGAGQISRERVQRGRLTRQITRS